MPILDINMRTFSPMQNYQKYILVTPIIYVVLTTTVEMLQKRN